MYCPVTWDQPPWDRNPLSWGKWWFSAWRPTSTSLQDLRTIADWTIRPRLLSTGGVAQVAVIGGDIKEYQILLDPARMKHYGISMDEVLGVVDNMNQNSTGGILYEYGNEYIVQGLLATNDVEELGKGVVKTVNNVRFYYPILQQYKSDRKNRN